MVSDRSAVLIAAVVTALLAVGLFAAERMALYDSLRMTMFRATGRGLDSDPFSGLYFLGGFLGGALAGYLTDGSWQAGGANGAKAGLLAAVLIYLLLVVPNILLAALEGGPVAIYVILVIPLVYVFPLALVFPFEAGFAGALTTWFRNA